MVFYLLTPCNKPPHTIWNSVICCHSQGANDGVGGPGDDESQHMDDRHLERLHDHSLGFLVMGSLGHSASISPEQRGRGDSGVWNGGRNLKLNA